ncbi:SMC-Scp complex subunit ScpB [Actinospica sp. MGRD01-02]|uniref:SMC-Scp complex subunit ScpB n=1 Tax=Actinospica acidithermotolerans TaxID=2828514 RepID=A0A941EHY3_9ACTN|nr:SMC-Scp complex subunit ScpB [Actinospica acidithermotolerans]MBR7827974.1 SMC-Scp complex subunit ScpB [Actinospica acidithermotolerans]
MTEQPMSGGAAFWAARGVRIEPEVVDEEEFVEETTEVDEVVPQVAEGDAVEEPVEVVAEAGPEADAEQVTDPGQVAEVAEAEPKADVEQAADPEQVAEAEPQAGVGQTPDPEAEPDPEPEPESVEAAVAVEDSPLPGFPQQRSERAGEPGNSAPREPEKSAPRGPGNSASREPGKSTSGEPGNSASDEPAWQLTGGELALPLPPLKTCVEAILMVVDEPVSVVTLAQVLERPTAEVAEALRELAEEYTVLGRGFELREVGVGGEGERTGWRVYSRAECAPVVERFVRDGQQAKLTQAALETLAVVAYRQPVSRSKVSAIRGVNCDGVMRTLLARGLVEEYGNDHETGAVLYQTTGFFLERMGLKSLEELPDLAPLLPSAADVDVEDFA